MPTITTAATFWNAKAALESDVETEYRAGIEALIGLALHDPGAVGERAAEVLSARFGARVMLD
ncbi:MAG: hypothetical protein ING19_12775 [Azospirillum sp.]|nr:hypothetical protein [Azospirillum sp.]MCZ8123611.1 hypothetical protein [Magnetospirillum sp.]